MPSWCHTDFVFKGEKEYLDKFEDKLIDYTCKNFMENGFGVAWLGNIVLGYGFPYEESEFEFGGKLVDYDRLDDNRLFVSTMSGWHPMTKMWDEIIDKYYKDKNGNHQITYVYKSEEYASGLYINTDIKGDYFTERYSLEINSLEDNDQYIHTVCDSKEEVIQEINRFFNKEFEDYEQVLEFIEETEDNKNELHNIVIFLDEYETETDWSR